MAALPTVALSIRQPWAWLIMFGFKDIENRDWRTRHRGPILIHAAQTIDEDAHRMVMRGYHPVTGEPSLHGVHYPLHYLHRPGKEQMLGGIVGVTEIADVVDASDSPWFVGRYGFVLRNSRPLMGFRPLRGMPGVFSVEGRP